MLLMMHNSAAAIVSPIHRKAYSAASEVAMPHIKVEPDDDFKCKQHKQELRNTVYVNSDLVQNNIYNNFSKNNNNNSLSKCKRRINFTYSNLPGQQPTSVARRNARERNRVKQVNNGFATLRSHIPLSVAAAMTSPEAAAAEAASRTANKKLSKVETLRMAVEYIRSLQDMLEDPGSGPARQYDSYYPGVKHEDDSMSDTSTSPPPSSYASECSYVTPPSHHQNNNNNNNTSKYLDKEDAMSPEDEELLDVISWWQQSQ